MMLATECRTVVAFATPDAAWAGVEALCDYFRWRAVHDCRRNSISMLAQASQLPRRNARLLCCTSRLHSVTGGRWPECCLSAPMRPRAHVPTSLSVTLPNALPTAQAHFPHERLHGVSARACLAMLEAKGVRWECDTPEHFRL